MNINHQIRRRLRELGFRGDLKNEVDGLGVELTICQFIVVVLSIISVIFLFVPLFFLQDVRFLLIFFSLSLICLGIGVWFWVKKAEICEHPEEYN